MLGKSVECTICGDMISVESKVVPKNILVTECCNMTPLHRECIQVGELLLNCWIIQNCPIFRIVICLFLNFAHVMVLYVVSSKCSIQQFQHQADASGYFFRCPMCNNEKKFNNIMKIMGINVPQRLVWWGSEMNLTSS